MNQAAIVFRDGVTKIFPVKAQEKLLDAAFRHGVSLPLDCREGVCATCRGLCESGQVDMEYVDEDALSADEVAAGYVLACQTTLKTPASFYFDIDSSVCNVASKVFSGTVCTVEQVSDAAVIMELMVNDADHVQYLPGQYARLYIPGTDEHRAYSFATAKASAGKIKFLLRLLPDGVMSNYLRDRCQVGDELKLELPYGAFYLREVTRPLLLVAGGTGLSAILSILDQLHQDNRLDVPIRVLYGARKAADVSELAQLTAYESIFADYAFSIVLSDADDAWQGAKGFVTDVIDHDYLQNAFDAYLCGPPAMIAACESHLGDALNQQKIAPYQLYFEKFVSS